MYIGNGHWPQPSSIRHPNLSFKFEVVNSVDVDSRLLVDRGDMGDAVFAILCREGSSRDMIRTILDRIAQAPPEQQKDAFAQLLILSGLRKARHLVERSTRAWVLSSTSRTARSSVNRSTGLGARASRRARRAGRLKA